MRVIDVRLSNRAQGDATAIGEMLSREFGTNACLAGAVDQRGRRVKIFFDATGRAVRVEILDEMAAGDSRALKACLDAVIRRGMALGAPTAGYVVVTIERRR